MPDEFNKWLIFASIAIDRAQEYMENAREVAPDPLKGHVLGIQDVLEAEYDLVYTITEHYEVLNEDE